MSSSPLPDSLLIGIAGGTGSGKTTVARQIRNALTSEHCSLIDHDAYYRDLAHLPFEERVKTNFDCPSSLENELLAEHLRALRAGESIDKPVYDFANHVRSGEVERIAPAKVIIVEGILVLADAAKLWEHMDIKIFVDTAADVRVIRRIRRDMTERERSFEEIRAQYYRTVRPMHEMHVEPSRKRADLIIPEGGENRIAIGMVVRALIAMANEGS